MHQLMTRVVSATVVDAVWKDPKAFQMVCDQLSFQLDQQINQLGISSAIASASAITPTVWRVGDNYRVLFTVTLVVGETGSGGRKENTNVKSGAGRSSGDPITSQNFPRGQASESAEESQKKPDLVDQVIDYADQLHGHLVIREADDPERFRQLVASSVGHGVVSGDEGSRGETAVATTRQEKSDRESGGPREEAKGPPADGKQEGQGRPERGIRPSHSKARRFPSLDHL